MTCETTRQRLLNSERPDRPPADVQPHLAACAACRTWQRRLARIERQIPELPVPPSAPPPALMRHILNSPHAQLDNQVPGPNSGTPPWWVPGPVPSPNNGTPAWWATASETERGRPTLRPRTRPTPSLDRTRRKVALVFALTMGLAVFSLCWGLSPSSPPPAASTQKSQTPLAVRQSSFERDLARAQSPRERIRVAADFAGELERKALALTHSTNADDLTTVAALYVKVVREQLPEFARSLPREERAAVLENVARRLDGAESEMQRRLMEDVSPAAAVPLRDMAQAARAGSNHLWKLLREV